jgi:hypothetical protein
MLAEVKRGRLTMMLRSLELGRRRSVPGFRLLKRTDDGGLMSDVRGQMSEGRESRIEDPGSRIQNPASSYM